MRKAQPGDQVRSRCELADDGYCVTTVQERRNDGFYVVVPPACQQGTCYWSDYVLWEEELEDA